MKFTDHVTSRLHSTACGWLTYSGTSKELLKLHGTVAFDVNQQTGMFRLSWSILVRHSLQPYNSKFQQKAKCLRLSKYKQRYQHVVHSARARTRAQTHTHTHTHTQFQWRTQEFCFGEGGSTNSVEDRGQRERGSGCSSPYSGVLEAAVIW